MNASYITPAITLFREDGSLDKENQKALYENLIKNHIDGILVQGSIGEFFAMPMAQRLELAEFAIQTIDHRTLCLIGTASMIPEEIVPYSNKCLELGADGVVIIPPYYFRLDSDAVFRYFDELLAQINGNVYLYNFPDRTGYSMDAQTILKLAKKHKNLKGIKDTISGMDHTRELINVIKSEVPEFKVYSGFDDNTAHNVLSGGDGCIGGISNVIPELCTKWVAAIRSDDFKTVAECQQKINRLMDIYSISSNFIPVIKQAAKLRGIISSTGCIFPSVPTDDDQTEKIRNLLSKEGFL